MDITLWKMEMKPWLEKLQSSRTERCWKENTPSCVDFQLLCLIAVPEGVCMYLNIYTYEYIWAIWDTAMTLCGIHEVTL